MCSAMTIVLASSLGTDYFLLGAIFFLIVFPVIIAYPFPKFARCLAIPGLLISICFAIFLVIQKPSFSIKLGAIVVMLIACNFLSFRLANYSINKKK